MKNELTAYQYTETKTALKTVLEKKLQKGHKSLGRCDTGGGTGTAVYEAALLSGLIWLWMSLCDSS